MKYTSFEIINYKGIKNLKIDLTGRPDNKVYTFVGLNESGKTTILEAINTINQGYQKGNEHILIPKSKKANFTGKISVNATIRVEDEDNKRILEFVKKELGFELWMPIESFTIDACCEFENSNLKNRMNYWGIDTKVKKSKRQKAYTNIENENWHKVVNYLEEKLMPRIVYYENFLFKFPERIFLSGENSDKKDNINYKLVIEDILNDVVPNSSIDESIVEKYLASDSGSRDIFDAITTKLEERIAHEVFSSWGQLFNTKDYKPEIVLRFGGDKENGVYVEIKIKEKGESFYISERSLGFQWFFAFLFFTLFRINRKSDLGETIFMLDEPASNLHSGAQRRLLQTFERFVEDNDRPIKLLYTTHSHHLINPKWLEGTFVVKNNAINYDEIKTEYSSDTDISACTYKQFVVQHPNQTDYFQPVLDTLDYQPGLLEKIPNIVVTEGKSDYYILKYFNQIFFNNKYSEINLYPGAGCNKNFQVISLYLAWGRGCVILLDGDDAGKKAKIEYEKEFGTLIKNNILIYSDLAPMVGDVMIEDIFSSDEKLYITKLFDENAKVYKKSAFNTAIQTALINKQKIDISKETIKKFEKLLSGLNKHKFSSY